MAIYPATSDSINIAADIIKRGGLVAFPTETVYGLGANGLDATAVAKIFKAKERPEFNPLILHIADISWLPKLTKGNNEEAVKLAEKFWPGPLTIVLPKSDLVPGIVTSGNPTVAIRLPGHEVARKLIEAAGVPVAAPSANKFGFLSPTKAFHVENQLADEVDIILDGGQSKVGVESTIVKYEGGKFYLLRPGGVSVEELKAFTDNIIFDTNKNKPESPGQLPFHYSPACPSRFIDEYTGDLPKEKTALLLFSENNNRYNTEGYLTEKVLSKQGDYVEAAANLFSSLHELEEYKPELILVEKVKEQGLGVAIMDRLRRAVKRY